MVEIEVSRTEEIKTLLFKLVLDEVLFIGITYIFYLLRNELIQGVYAVPVIILINMLFIIIPFVTSLRKIELKTACYYNRQLNIIEVVTRKGTQLITPERYLIMTIRQIKNKYYVYEGLHGIVIPSNSIVLTDKGYKTWRAIYSDIVNY